MTWYDNECGGPNAPLSCVTDSVTICSGDDPIVVEGTVELGPFTLAALETITVLQGTSPWVVSATNLDIRDLDCLIDSIEVCQGTSPWVVSGVISATVDFDYAEDSPHVSGDVGAFVLTVRNDLAAALTSANGDYSPIATDSAGRVGISDLGGSVTVDAVNLDIRDLVFATDKVDISGSTVDPIDDYDTFEAQHVTLTPSTDTIITFSSPARLVRISNWDIANRILVKDGAITSDSDITAARVGRSPATDVPGQMYFPFATITVHIRSAAGSEVTIEGYKGSV